MTFQIKNKIPEEIYADWQIYTEILFHLIQNAFKFSKKGWEIKISVVYCQFEYEQNNHSISSRGLYQLGHPSSKKSDELRTLG